MVFPPNLSAIVSLAVLILSFLLTLPTFRTLFNKAISKSKTYEYEELHKLYEDRDGVATKESQKEYSVAIPKYVALSSSIIGFLASTAIAVFASVHFTEAPSIENWLWFGSWVREFPDPLRLEEN